MQIINVHGIRIINDTYNANLQSMIEAVKFLNKLNNCQRKILIFRRYVELGEKAKIYMRIWANILQNLPWIYIL